MDDFGTGHASLAYLARLPVDRVEIDRSFVSGMDADDADRTIVRSTVDLGHALGLSVVAEGVETEQGRQALAAYGCDLAQGYWLARPFPGGDIPDRVAGLERRLLADRPVGAARHSALPSSA